VRRPDRHADWFVLSSIFCATFCIKTKSGKAKTVIVERDSSKARSLLRRDDKGMRRYGSSPSQSADYRLLRASQYRERCI
jgi:hypothetical protein